ncbi:MAG: AmmeMemoRadiSam system protein B [Tepidisphaeraceae bacterium]
MSGPTDEAVRLAAFAGLFYPADAGECRSLAASYVGSGRESSPSPGAQRWMGGIVPHAGWMCSGAIAGLTVGSIARSWKQAQPGVVVVFAAIHTPLPTEVAALDTFAAWTAPVDRTEIAIELRSRLAQCAARFRADDRFHSREHAVEVELPLIRAAWPDAMVLPVEVPVIEGAIEIGADVARTVGAMGLDAVYLASSDLTHYGPTYRFAPAGLGLAGLEWAKKNDRRLLDRVERLDTRAIVAEVRQNLNACGGGAIAAMLAACRERGASQARILRHASSYETLRGVAEQSPDNAVGYASAVVG